MLRLKKLKGEITLENSVVARGTSRGLILRINGNLDYPQLKDLLSSFLLSKKGFLAGKNNHVSFEWTSSVPSKSLIELLKKEVLEEFGLTLRDSVLYSEALYTEARDVESSTFSGIQNQTLEDSNLGLSVQEVNRNTSTNELLGGLSAIETLNKISVSKNSSVIRRKESDLGGFVDVEDLVNWNQPNCLMVMQTLRSGQKIESEDSSIVIVGDVNHGSEVKAAGNVIVLGSLRGVAHAGAFDDDTRDKFIFALSLLPTQLRIGSVITRGIGGENQRSGDFIPEFAKVEGETIVVQSYVPRKLHF
jgi:septum site-determining protein MinC